MYNKKTADELSKLLLIVNDKSVPAQHKELALERMKHIKDQAESQELIRQGVDPNRAMDILYLLKSINNPLSSREDVARAKLSLELIRNESKEVKEMRKSLIREIRNGKVDNARDISEEALKSSNWQNKLK